MAVRPSAGHARARSSHGPRASPPSPRRGCATTARARHGTRVTTARLWRTSLTLDAPHHENGVRFPDLVRGAMLSKLAILFLVGLCGSAGGPPSRCARAGRRRPRAPASPCRSRSYAAPAQRNAREPLSHARSHAVPPSPAWRP